MSVRNRDQGIAEKGAQFDELVALSRRFLGERKYQEAAAVAQIAALYGPYNHHGAFLSGDLEGLLVAIGLQMPRPARPDVAPSPPRSAAPRRVLHVLTAAKDVGGDSRFVWRWIERDRDRTHSVALTYQLDFPVPGELSSVVAGAGGTVHVLDSKASPIERARALRTVARQADVVFLHTYVEDVIPVIAFADKADLPPVVFVVQADHQFWIGAAVADLFVHLRASAERLSQERRGIPADRCATLPIPLNPARRAHSRSEAKRALGLPRDAVVLLSIARAIKYVPIEPPGFPEVLARIVRRHANAILIAVGPDMDAPWQAASEATGGRVRALGQRSDTQLFYEAADVYIDSFPFASNTSLLEAGSYELPLVSYYPHTPQSAVLGPGAPGLDPVLGLATSVDEFEQMVSRLIVDEPFRSARGITTRNEIVAKHAVEGWNLALADLYRRVEAVGSGPVRLPSDCGRLDGEIDLLLNRYYSRHFPLGWIVGWYARHLAFVPRIRVLLGLLAIERSFSFAMFLPNGVSRRLSVWCKGWRRLPGVSRWLLRTSSPQ